MQTLTNLQYSCNEPIGTAVEKATESKLVAVSSKKKMKINLKAIHFQKRDQIMVKVAECLCND